MMRDYKIQTSFVRKINKWGFIFKNTQNHKLKIRVVWELVLIAKSTKELLKWYP